VLNIIYYPVSAILWFWHKVFGAIPFLGPSNGITWALAVVFLVFTLRALLFRPFVAQVRSMRKMQEFAPEIRKLQEKHKGDRQKLAAEMQKLQSEHGVNPLGGCLPMLVQIPVFIGLFQVLREFKRGKTENYVFRKDEVESFINADLFGAKLSAFINMAQRELAELGTDRLHVAAVAIPLMITASIATHVTARHSVERQSAAAAANPQAAIMNKLTLYIFPLGVLVGGFFFPMAIIIYWLANNAWTLGQQWVVYRRIDREEAGKKEAATAQRQSLAPRPGQKPAVKPKRPTNGQPPAAPDPADGTEPQQADDASSDGGPRTGSAATGKADAVPDDVSRGATAGEAASDVSRETSAGAAPDRRQSENGSRPPQRKQPQRVSPPRKNRKRR
jgi:YidC/Oxa1 family membrane protein insertase